MTTPREVRIDEVDLPDLDANELFTTQHERWVNILVAAGEPGLAEELRREITARRHVFRTR